MYQVKLASERSITGGGFESIPPTMAQPARPDSRDAIGARLRLIRLAYGRLIGRERDMTQAEFSALCGVNRQAWNNAETGDFRLGLDNAMAVARRTGVSLDYIYFGLRDRLPHALAVEMEKLEAAPRPARRA